jgi:chromosome segregation ATPase
LSKQATHRRELVDEKNRNALLEKQLRQAETRLGEAHKQLRDLRSMSGNDMNVMKSFKRNNGPVERQIETTGEASLKQLLMQSQQERKHLADAVRNEALAGEEQRVYIRVLEHALKLKVEEMGIAGQDDILIELARMKEDLEKAERQRDSHDRDIALFRAEVEEQRDNGRSLQRQVEDEQNQRRAVEQKLSRFNESDESLHATIKQLENEKNALLEYVQDTVDRTAVLQKQVDALTDESAQARKLEGAASKRAAGLESTAAELEVQCEEQKICAKDLTAEIEALQLELEGVRRQSLMNETEVVSKDREIEEMASIQVEWLEQVKDAKAETRSLKDELGTMKEKLLETEMAGSALRQDQAVTLRTLERSEKAKLSLEIEVKELRENNFQLEVTGRTLESQQQKLSKDVELRTMELSTTTEREGESRSQLMQLRSSHAELESEAMRLREWKRKCDALEEETKRACAEPAERVCIDDGQDALDVSSMSGRMGNTPIKHSTVIEIHGRAWCSNPLIRELFPCLFEAVQSLDYHAGRIESALKDAVTATGLEKKEKAFTRRMLEEEAQQLRLALEKAQEDEVERNRELSMNTQELARLSIACETAEVRLGDVQGQLSMKDAKLGDNCEELRTTRLELMQVQQRVAQLTAELHHEQHEHARVSSDAEQWKRQVGSAQQRIGAQQTDMEEVASKLRIQEDECRRLSGVKSALEVQVGQITDEKGSWAKRAQDLSPLENKVAEQRQEILLLRGQLDSSADLGERQNGLVRRLESRQAELEGAQQQAGRLGHDVQQAESMVRSAIDRIKCAHEKHASTLGLHEGLSALNSSTSYIGSPSKRALGSSMVMSGANASNLGGEELVETARTAVRVVDFVSQRLAETETEVKQLRAAEAARIRNEQELEVAAVTLRSEVELVTKRLEVALTEGSGAQAEVQTLREQLHHCQSQLTGAQAELERSRIERRAFGNQLETEKRMTEVQLGAVQDELMQMKRVHTEESRARSHAERTNLDLTYSNKEMERALEHKDTLLTQEHQDLAQLKAKNEALQNYASTQALQRQLAQNRVGRISSELEHERAKSPDKMQLGSPLSNSGRFGYNDAAVADSSAIAGVGGVGGSARAGGAGAGGRQRSPRDTLKSLQLKYGVQASSTAAAEAMTSSAYARSSPHRSPHRSPHKASSPSKFQTSPSKAGVAGGGNIYSPAVDSTAGAGVEAISAFAIAVNPSSRLDQLRNQPSISANMSPAGLRLQVWRTHTCPPPTCPPPPHTHTHTQHAPPIHTCPYTRSHTHIEPDNSLLHPFHASHFAELRPFTFPRCCVGEATQCADTIRSPASTTPEVKALAKRPLLTAKSSPAVSSAFFLSLLYPPTATDHPLSIAKQRRVWPSEQIAAGRELLSTSGVVCSHTMFRYRSVVAISVAYDVPLQGAGSSEW